MDKKYVKLSQREHVLRRTPMYAGAALGLAAHAAWVPVERSAAADAAASPAAPSEAAPSPAADTSSAAAPHAHGASPLPGVAAPSLATSGGGSAGVVPSGHPASGCAESTKRAAAARAAVSFAFEPALVYSAVLLKLFDEVVVNASDHYVRMRREGGAPVKRIDIAVDASSGRITVENDGDGVDVVLDAATGLHAPELIFGHLLAGSNFEDDGTSTIGGTNGIGIKMTNVFSREFTVVTVDGRRRLSYAQTWRDNMASVAPPQIKAAARGAVGEAAPPKTFTRVSFVPDMLRLGYSGPSLPRDTLRVLEKRAWDLAACLAGSGVRVTWNKRPLRVPTFAAFAAMHLPREAPTAAFSLGAGETTWQVVVAARPPELALPDRLMAVSFVNGIPTYSNGTHVALVASQVARAVAEAAAKAVAKAQKRDVATPPPSQVEGLMAVFVCARLPSPTFASQSKEQLKTALPKTPLPEEALRRVLRLPLVAAAADALSGRDAARDARLAKATDGSKSRVVRGLPKLEDATKAGGRESAACRLVLTEGDSAKSLVMSGLSAAQRELYGIFPLKGKVLNAADASAAKLLGNAEIEALKKILGLVSGRDYSTAAARAGLRYGSVILMTDQDADGAHIRGLLINLFYALWPSLLRATSFLRYLPTPIVIAPGPGGPRDFFSLAAYNAWRDALLAGGRAVPETRYLKGLGSSTRDDAQRYFRKPRLVDLVWEPPQPPPLSTADAHGMSPSEDALDLAFGAKRTADRKEWLLGYAPAVAEAAAAASAAADDAATALPISRFVHTDLRDYSFESLVRALPSGVDGLKESQRKVLFTMFKRNVTRDFKVAALAGAVEEAAAYLHGEVSLAKTIVGMAQDFVGSNNAPLLVGSGQFGSRLEGGKDAASGRYIFTRLSPLARALFPPDDDAVLSYKLDDGTPIEPRHYVPVLPFVLLNGGDGIATGFSTSVPCYNPLDVLARVRARVCGDETAETPWQPVPWYAGFRGTIAPRGSEGASCRGVLALEDAVERSTRAEIASFGEAADADTDADALRARMSSLASTVSSKSISAWELGAAATPATTPATAALVRVTFPRALTRAEATATLGAGARLCSGALQATTVLVTELPVGRWTQTFKAHLEKLVDSGDVLNYTSKSTDLAVHFRVSFATPRTAEAAEAQLKLTEVLSTSNMHLFAADGTIVKYSTAAEIVEAFLPVREALYVRRRDAMLAGARSTQAKHDGVVAFLELMLSNRLVLADKPRAAVEAELAAHGLPRWRSGHADEESTGSGYDYLLRLPFASITREALERHRASSARAAADVVRLEATTVRDLWLADLDAFGAIYRAYAAARAAAGDAPQAPLVAKGAPKRSAAREAAAPAGRKRKRSS